MIKRIGAGIAVGFIVGVSGTAVAATAFDSSTPPALPGWMTRACISQPTDTPHLANCYWNSTMGLTNAHGRHARIGFWIRKLPDQNVTCYFFSPDTAKASPGSIDHEDACYGSLRWTHKIHDGVKIPK